MDGGGALMNQGIHTIDLMQWLMGPIKRVSAMTTTLAHERIEVEDTGAATVEFANGALGSIACTTSMWPGHFRIVEVSGNQGTVAMADSKFFFWQFAEETERDNEIRRDYMEFPAVSIGAADPSAGVTADCHRMNFADFRDAVDQGVAPAHRAARRELQRHAAIGIVHRRHAHELDHMGAAMRQIRRLSLDSSTSHTLLGIARQVMHLLSPLESLVFLAHQFLA